MNQNNFQQQTQEAIEKMRQMQKLAKDTSKNEGSAKKTEPKSHKTQNLNGNTFPFLDSLFENGDMTVIIGLLLLLMSEKADKKLLFALVYILL